MNAGSKAELETIAQQKYPAIGGLREVSFLDWDGKVAGVIFLLGCNFRCPYCHNADLVFGEKDGVNVVPLEKTLQYLDRMRDWLDGVVICGGEPTVWPQLPQFIRLLREGGKRRGVRRTPPMVYGNTPLQIKLDTNGSNPAMLQRLIVEGLVDYVAMDVKAAPTPVKYHQTIGHINSLSTPSHILPRIKASINLLLTGVVDYEFRTTLCPSLHNQEDIVHIGKEIAGAKKWVLQSFHASDMVLHPDFREQESFSAQQLSDMQKIAAQYVSTCHLVS